jgi:four helix bundle protein
VPSARHGVGARAARAATTAADEAGREKETDMPFDALEAAVSMVEALAPVEGRIRAKRKSLADEVGRAGESVALNISEGRMRAGLDRADLYRRAAGSAAELTTALRIARARGYVTAGDVAAVEQLLDRVRAMLWRLTH